MRKRPTIKDIAKLAGTTHSTVSRVITGNATISGKMQDKVRAAMKKLDYHPNLIARGLVRSKTRAFALIVPELDPHVLPIIRGISDTCRKHSYGLMLFSTDYWADENLSFLGIAKNWLVDGIFIYNVVYRKNVSAAVKALRKDRTPFVFINKYLGTGLMNSVSTDNANGVFKAVQHLAGLGHKKIGIINGGMTSVDGVERFEAFKNALGAFGIEYDPKLAGIANFSGEEAYLEMKRILASGARPTAVFCANDFMATGAARAAQERGLRVPKDISIVGYDDWEGAKFFKPALTTIKPNLEKIGPRAIDLMLELMENPDMQPKETAIEPELIIRSSTAPCRKA